MTKNSDYISIETDTISEGDVIKFSEDVSGEEGIRTVVAKVISERFVITSVDDYGVWKYVLECQNSFGVDAIQPGTVFFRRGNFFSKYGCVIYLERQKRLAI